VGNSDAVTLSCDEIKEIPGRGSRGLFRESGSLVRE
jgi:hypothetical protein